MKWLYDLIMGAVKGCYTMFFNGLNNVNNTLNVDMISELSTSIDTVQTVMKGVCTAVMTIFMLLELISMIEKEDIDEKFIFKMIMKLGFTRFLIYYAPQLMELIGLTANFWCSELYLTSVDGGAVLAEIEATVANAIPENGSGIWGMITATLQQLFGAVPLLLQSVIVLVAYIFISVFPMARNVEMVLLTAVSALPICFITYSGTKEITKKFFLKYTSVCLQGVLLMVCVSVYFGLVSYAGSDMWQLTLYNILLIIMVAKTGTWSKEILGLA